MANFYKKSQSAGDETARVWAGGKEKMGNAVARVGEKKKQLGRSMIEMLGVLAIIGVLSIAGIAGYTKAMEKHNINKLKDQVAIILTNIATALANGQDSSQLTGEVINALHILPSEMGSYSNCRHALGGRCYVGPGGGNDRYVSVRFADLSKSACAELATLDMSFSQRKSVINATNSIVISSENCVTDTGESTCKFKMVRTIAEAIQECKGKKNAVVFLFNTKF